MDRYTKACNYILDIPRFGGKNSLSDTHELLEKVYEEGSALIVHIAGTNGKGSVTNYLNSILLQSGKTVGMFTSPHLVKMNERIRINGVDISDDDFADCFDNIMKLVKKEGSRSHPSFFEFVFLMAMDYFARNHVEYILLETGLGGRLDATNCVEKKDLCIITRIGIDHTEYLGDTIAKIAAEKAGIISEGVPTVFFENDDESADVIRKACEEKNSICYSINVKNAEITSTDKQSIDFSLGCSYYRLRGLKVTTSALYQVCNASLAVMGAYVLMNGNWDENAVSRGLLEAFWPARMEQIMPGIFLDGAHNTDGIDAFLSSVRACKDTSGKCLLLFSVVKDKNYDEMVDLIVDSGLFSHIFAAPLESSRGLPIAKLKEIFGDRAGANVSCYDNVKEAFEAACDAKGIDDRLYIAGSLYLAGQIEELLRTEK